MKDPITYGIFRPGYHTAGIYVGSYTATHTYSKFEHYLKERVRKFHAKQSRVKSWDVGVAGSRWTTPKRDVIQEAEAAEMSMWEKCGYIFIEVGSQFIQPTHFIFSLCTFVM
jgi:hypothetical protein